MAEKRYHMRRAEKEITDEKEIREVIAGQEFMTLAMCSGGSPYLATVNYAFDPKSGTFYFHCARKGRKSEVIESNPEVWGQVLEDGGYIEGKCDYAYRSVHFWGKAEAVTALREKRAALELMLQKLEKNPEAAKRKFINDGSLREVMIYRVRAEGFTGKKSVRPRESGARASC